MKNRKRPSGGPKKDSGTGGRDSSFEGDKGLGQEASAVRKPIHYGIFGAGLPPSTVKTPKRLKRR